MHDVAIIGGGVIGLSLAWEMAKHGRTVHVIDQSEPGREASWAGAGILPAACYHAWQHPAEQLRGLAAELHPRWAEELKAATGIDTGYRRCGALHLARTPGEAAALSAWATLMSEEGVEVTRLKVGQFNDLEPGLAISPRTGRQVASDLSTQDDSQLQYSAVFHVPAEAQLRNPRHLQALFQACLKAGVEITSNAPVGDFTVYGGGLRELETTRGSIQARQFCLTAGAWTGALLRRLGISAGIMPIRGQMIMFRCEKPPLARIINEGSRYLVPRDDGRVLAGSTEEEVGFDKRNTEEAVADLVGFAHSIVPALRDAAIERTWAGLRPGSFDGLPYLGRLPGLQNAFVAAGHFRTGLFLSPATAVVMSELMRGEQPRVDLAPFRVGR